MKQKYLSPELEVTLLAVEDVLTVSNEVGLDSDGLFGDSGSES